MGRGRDREVMDRHGSCKGHNFFGKGREERDYHSPG